MKSITRLVGRRYPLLKTRGRVANYLAVDEIARVRLRSGLTIEVDAGDYNGGLVAVFGEIEPGITRLCRRLLGRGDVLLDIGANCGAVGLNCVDVVGDDGAVHLFEPQDDLCRRATECVRRHHLTNVHVHQVALLDRDAAMSLSVPPRHSGGATLTNDGTGKVAVRDTEGYVRRIVEGRPFGAKLDAEGSEDRILPGLLSCGPRWVIFESNTPEQQEHLWSVVTDHGMRVLGVQNGWLRPRTAPLSSPEDMAPYHDFLAVA